MPYIYLDMLIAIAAAAAGLSRHITDVFPQKNVTIVEGLGHVFDMQTIVKRSKPSPFEDITWQ